MKSLDALTQSYIDASTKYGEAQLLSNSKLVNKQSKIINEIREQLTATNNLQVLVPLLEHSNDYVRLKTAYSVIPVAPEKARKTLLELMERKKLLGFEAKMTLTEWENGNLKF